MGCYILLFSKLLPATAISELFTLNNDQVIGQRLRKAIPLPRWDTGIICRICRKDLNLRKAAYQQPTNTYSMNFLAIFLAAVSLAGSWQFRFEEKKSIEEVRNLEFIADDVMTVPGCWDMMPRYFLKRGTALFRKTFHVDETMRDAVLEVEGDERHGE